MTRTTASASVSWCLVTLCVPVARAGAQVEWSRAPLAERRAGPVAFDSARGRLVLVTNGPFGALETWEWDGTTWALRQPPASPSQRRVTGIAYDAARARVLLFGGLGPGGMFGVPLADTWEWDGTTWTQRTPPASPPGRVSHAMTFDSARARVVLFGGSNGAVKFPTYYADTWEWDGATWTQRTPGTAPPPRADHRLVFDTGRGRTVLFGGQNNLGTLGDTWEWDGQAWGQRNSPQAPSARVYHAMGFDAARGRTVLFGGTPELGDTWEWDGTSWQQRAPAPSPSPRILSHAAYDPGRQVLLLFSGASQNEIPGDLWHWNGLTWALAGPPVTPQPRHSHALVFDAARSRVVLFGGINSQIFSDTWEWDGSRWQQRAPAASPPARLRHAMAYDSLRQRTVLFGGELPGPAGDTWEYDGTTWLARPAAVRPSARFDHAMAFDAARGRVVLFGGGGGASQNDTWEWDGTNWTQRFPATAPPVRRDHQMAFDRKRSRVVLFGGSGLGFGALLNDTWEWDGSNWAQRLPATSPPARADSALAYDEARERTVLFGGGFALLADVWEWDGTDWSQRATAAVPAARSRHALAYDAARRRVVLYGGQSIGPNYSDTWEYGPRHPAAFTAFGSGCAGSAGVPVLSAAGGSLPWLGGTFLMDLAPLPPANPALVWLGASNQRWGGANLPLDLTGAGFTGCFLRASPDVFFVAARIAGSAQASIPLPADPSLLGGSIHSQGLVVDPPANPAGAALSQGGTLLLGGR